MSEPRRKTKYKYTRELVKIAINEGLSQVEIAKLCRTTQSVVSGWFRGDGKASAQQIQPLVERFGARLNRTTSRVYIVRSQPTTVERWEETPRAKRLLALQDCPKEQLLNEPDFVRLRKEIPTPARAWGRELSVLMEADRARFDARTRPESLLRVEGSIVFRYSFSRPVVETRRGIDQLGEEPLARWFVHHQPATRRFVLVVQQRRLLSEAQAEQWQRTIEVALPHSDAFRIAERLSRAHDIAGRWVRSRDEATCWLSDVHGPMDSAALLDVCDRYFADATTHHDPHDDVSCPWLLRKMLVEHGYDVPGVVRLGDGE